MLKRSQRLSKAEFDRIFKTGKRFHFPHLSIIHSPNDSLRCSVVVGKKVAKSAVRRNTIRRRIYGQLSHVLVAEGRTGDFIILVKPSFASLGRKTANEIVVESIAQAMKSA